MKVLIECLCVLGSTCYKRIHLLSISSSVRPVFGLCRSATSEEVANITGVAEERFSRVGTSPADLHGMWYPTVRRTLMCLFKLYRCVDRSIFQVRCCGVLVWQHMICVISYLEVFISV